MSQAIIDQARSLAEMISESEVLTKLRTAEGVMGNDPIAQELIQRFQVLRNKENVAARQDGSELDEADKAEMVDLEKRIDNNATISAYMDAQSEFASLMESINFLIMKGINGDMSDESCETSGGCSSCGGCGH